jgi:hypothetical protein
MTIHVSVRSTDQAERVEIGVEPALETFTVQPFAASSGGR